MYYSIMYNKENVNKLHYDKEIGVWTYICKKGEIGRAQGDVNSGIAFFDYENGLLIVSGKIRDPMADAVPIKLE